MKKMIKKVIAPVLVITVLFAVLRPFCIQDGKCNYFLLLLLMGIPFGIGKMCVWMVPKGFDLGGTLAVWTMNLLIGGLIGSIVLLAMIGQAIIYLCVFLITVLTGIHKTVSGPILRRFFCLPPGLAKKAVPLYNNRSVQREVTAWSIGNT